MPERRVSHYWDSKKETGKWFKEVFPQLLHTGPVQWDACYLYGPDAERPEINKATEPRSRITFGRTILQARKELLEGIESLNQPGEAAPTADFQNMLGNQ